MWSESKQGFLQTEDSQRSLIRSVFERLSAAKIIADGIVIPNLVLNKKVADSKLPESFGQVCYTLSFVTSNKKLYSMEFDSFFLT